MDVDEMIDKLYVVLFEEFEIYTLKVNKTNTVNKLKNPKQFSKELVTLINKKKRKRVRRIGCIIMIGCIIKSNMARKLQLLRQQIKGLIENNNRRKINEIGINIPLAFRYKKKGFYLLNLLVWLFI